MTWNLSRLLSTSNFLYLWLLREIFSLLKSFNSLGFLFPPNSTRIDRNSSVYYRDWRFMSTFKIGPLDNRSLLGLGHNIITGHLVWSWVGAWQFEDPDIINARKSDMKFSLEQLNWPHYYPLKVHVTFFITLLSFIFGVKNIFFFYFIVLSSHFCLNFDLNIVSHNLKDQVGAIIIAHHKLDDQKCAI